MQTLKINGLEIMPKDLMTNTFSLRAILRAVLLDSRFGKSFYKDINVIRPIFTKNGVSFGLLYKEKTHVKVELKVYGSMIIDGQVSQEYFPDKVKQKVFYRPSNSAFEREIRIKMIEQYKSKTRHTKINASPLPKE